MLITLKIIAQLVTSLGLLNVWLVRYHRPTAFRGGNAKSMKEEFAVYGLPTLFVYLVGFSKIVASVFLLIGIWKPEMATPAAVVVSVLMVGAILMHVKVGDPVLKSVPAMTVLALSLFVAFVSY